MNKKVAVLAVAVLAGCAALAWYFSRPAANDKDLVLYGNIDLRQVALAFNGSERIARLNVEEGQSVKAGDVLGELDTRALTLRLAQSRAQSAAQEQVLARLKAGNRPEELAQARARTTQMQADAEVSRQQLDRVQAVFKESNGRAVSKQDVDNAEAKHKAALAQLDATRKAQELVQNGARREDVAQAQAQLDAARADIAVLEYQLSEAQLKAPVNAVVRARLMEPGDMAAPQRPVYTLAIANPKWVRTYVKESDLGRIKPGMAASIRIDSQQDTIAGKIGYISSVAEFTPKTVQTEDLRTALVYEVRVLADDKADRLRMGMPATVRVALAQ
jgi:HlyD family secretion protein